MTMDDNDDDDDDDDDIYDVRQLEENSSMQPTSSKHRNSKTITNLLQVCITHYVHNGKLNVS